MKNTRYLSVTVAGFIILMCAAKADPVVTDPADNPDLQLDPDGVPLSISRPQDPEPTQEQINAMHKAQEKAALDKDWLLRTYERQMQSRAVKSGDTRSANLYYQLSTNKELAKLAGLTVIDTDTQDGAVPVPHSIPGAAKLRPSISSASLLNSTFSTDLLKPLVTPFGASGTNGQQNDYSSLLDGSTPSLLSDHPQMTPPKPAPDENSDPADIETPGMIAAEKDPLANPAPPPDLTLDILPGETAEQAREHQLNNTTLELPLPMDETQLHKQQSATLSVPGAPPKTQTTAATTTPVKPVPMEDPNAPIPVSKEPQINPVRAPIASPFDILHR